MMKYSLLFDGGCSKCSQVAHAIQKMARGRVEPVDITSSKARQLLELARPTGWVHRPYLVLQSNGEVRVWEGLGMAMRLVGLVGPLNAIRIMRLVYPLRWWSGPRTESRPRVSRRYFLRVGVASFLIAGLRLVWPAASAHACVPCADCGCTWVLTSCSNWPCCCFSPGAIKEYTCYDNKSGEPCETKGERCCFCIC